MLEHQLTLDPHQVMKDLNVVIQRIDDRSWQISANIPKNDLVSITLTLQKLRTIKSIIADQYHVPIENLEFSETTTEQLNATHIRASILIIQSEMNYGASTIVLCSEFGPENLEYANMCAKITAYPFDETQEKNTVATLEKVLISAGIQQRFILDSALQEAIALLERSESKISELVVARGMTPELSQDAQLKCAFELNPNMSEIGDYLSNRRASSGAIVCTKIPARNGTQSGVNLHGVEIPCTPGRDFTLVAGIGTTTNDGLQVRATTSGVTSVEYVKRNMHTPTGVQNVLEKVVVSVAPTVVIDGNDRVEIATDKSVEVRGNLRVGSVINTTGEVVIFGDIAANSQVNAKGSIIVKGNVTNASLTSEQNALIDGNIDTTTISVPGSIKVSGEVKNSTISGSSFDAHTVTGCKIVAERKITLAKIGVDEKNLITSLVVGMKDFYESRINDNNEFISRAEANIDRLRTNMDKSIIDIAVSGNIQLAFLKHVSNIRRLNRNITLNNDELETQKRLLETVVPTMALIRARKEENMNLSEHIQLNSQSTAKITISEGVSQPTEVRINGEIRLLQPGQPIEIG